MDLLQRSVAEYEKEFEMLEKYQITDRRTRISADTTTRISA